MECWSVVMCELAKLVLQLLTATEVNIPAEGNCKIVVQQQSFVEQRHKSAEGLHTLVEYCMLADVQRSSAEEHRTLVEVLHTLPLEHRKFPSAPYPYFLYILSLL